MPILFARTASLGGPSRNVSMASRYILRAMKMSPRISGERVTLGTCEGAGTGDLVPSSMAFGCDCAMAKVKPAASSRARGREKMRAHPLCAHSTANGRDCGDGFGYGRDRKPGGGRTLAGCSISFVSSLDIVQVRRAARRLDRFADHHLGPGEILVV